MHSKEFKNNLKIYSQSEVAKLAKLVQLGMSKGWYLNETFLFIIEREDIKEEDDLDCFMKREILSQWNELWQMITQVSPARKNILTEAKIAFENEMYGAAIHIYFSQADGIFADKFEKGLFDNKGTVAKSKFNGHLTDLIAIGDWDLLIEQYKDGSIYQRTYNEVYKEAFSVTKTDLVKGTRYIPNEKDLVIPNRHGVLHGIHKDYGTELNALKCLSLLLFIMHAIFRDEIYEKI